MDPLQQPPQPTPVPSYAPLPPEQPNDVSRYAGFWVRWVALLIDAVIVNIVTFIIGFILGFVVFAGMGKKGAAVAPILGGLSGLIVSWGYFIWMTHTKGATLGKMALNLTVVSEEGTKLPLGKIVLRETIGKAISALIFLIGYLMAAFTQKKQALHDKISGSIVIYKDPSKKPSGALITVIVILSLVVPIALIGILSTIVMTSLHSASAQLHASSTLDIQNKYLDGNEEDTEDYTFEERN